MLIFRSLLALCLQPPGKKRSIFHFLLTVMLCWTFHRFGEGQKQGGHKVVSEGGPNTWKGMSALCDITEV